jgi:hypothetical protein
MKFKVNIEEHIVQEFEIEADSAEEARELAESEYKNGKLVLENSEVHTTLMSVEDSEWVEI